MIRAVRIVLYILAALVAVVGLLLVFLATPPGRAVVASLAERAVAGTGLTLSIDRLTGWPPFSFGADRIVLGDAEGPFAEIEGLSVDLAVAGLLRREIVLDALHAERVVVSREPVLPPSDGAGGGSALALAAREFSVARLELEEGIVVNPAALSLAGAFSSARDGSIAARIDADRSTVARGPAAARATGRRQRAIMVDATLQEGRDGILLGLMGRRMARPTASRPRPASPTVPSTVPGPVSDGDAGCRQLQPASIAEAASACAERLRATLPNCAPAPCACPGAIEVAVDVAWAGARHPAAGDRQRGCSTGALRAELGRLWATDSDPCPSWMRGRAEAPVLPLGGGSTLAFDSVDVWAGRAGDGLTCLDIVGRSAGPAVAGSTSRASASLAVEAPGDDPLAVTSLAFALGGGRRGDRRRAVPGGEATPLVLSGQGT
jgi:hypothetical protein